MVQHSSAILVCTPLRHSARRAQTVLFSARAATGRLSKSPKRKGVRTKVPIKVQTTPPPFLSGVRF